MAFEKKKENTALKQLKADLKTGELAKLYLFYGEESYLKEHYRDQMIQKLCPADIFRLLSTNFNKNSASRRYK